MPCSRVITVNNIGVMLQRLIMMVASTVLPSLPSKNEYQHASLPPLCLTLVSGANKMGYMCTFMDKNYLPI